MQQNARNVRLVITRQREGVLVVLKIVGMEIAIAEMDHVLIDVRTVGQDTPVIRLVQQIVYNVIGSISFLATRVLPDFMAKAAIVYVVHTVNLAMTLRYAKKVMESVLTAVKTDTGETTALHIVAKDVLRIIAMNQQDGV